MSTNGAPSPGVTSAPSSAPTSAPVATPAPASNGTRAAPGGALNGAPHPPSGLQQAPEATETLAPPRPKYPYKTKIGDAEHEIDLADYKHRVKIDGQEYELGLSELASNQERLRASMKRFDEASRMKRDAEAMTQRVESEKQGIIKALREPQSALALVKRALGVERFNETIVAEVKKLLAYERMPDDQRALHDQHSQREEQLARRQAEIDRREALIKRDEEQRIQRLQVEREKALLAEWIPALERVGLPAKHNGEPNKPIVRMLARKLREARDLKAPMTLEEAAQAVREDYEALVAPELARRQQQTLAQIETQPGRSDPEPRTAPPQRREPRKQHMTAADFERNLRKTWQPR